MSKIFLKKEEIIEKFLKPLNSPIYSKRVHSSEDLRERNDGPFQRDYARIMYASSFRRLQGKMQLLGIKEEQFFRNRLTHSLEVAQIAQSLAYEIGYERAESFVVEAGAIAHDIGNPPFGHSGESKLNEIFYEIGGFEGNAQTLRILTTIERKKPEFQGLNLTYRTLLSVVKYYKKFERMEQDNNINSTENGSVDEKKKKKQKFIYDDDYELLNKFIDENKICIRTLDVQIVDLADEIAYAAHDLEDGLRQNYFTIDEILHDYKVTYGETSSYDRLKTIVHKCRENAGYGKNKVESSQYSKMFRQELSSMIINTLIQDIGLVKVSDKKRKKTGSMQEEELDFVEYREMAEGLKDIIFKCITHRDEIYLYEEKGNKIIEGLADIYMNNNKLLPPEYREEEIKKQYNIESMCEESQKNLQQRLICDYISGMMDSYAVTSYKKYKGIVI